MKQLSTLVLLFFTLSFFAQSPWAKKKKEAYLQFSFSTISYDKVFGNPDYTTNREITDNTLQLYGEYGITDKTTLFATLPLKFLNAGDLVDPTKNLTAEGTETSLGNIQVGVKHNFYKKDNWVVSGQLGIETNTSSFDTATGLRTGLDAWTFTPLFLAGKSFSNSYFQSFIGVDIRTNDYSSNFKIGGEYGGKISKDLWLIGFVDIVASFDNGEVIVPSTNILTATYVNNQDYGGFGAKIIYEITKKIGVNGGIGGAFFGNNVAKAPALSIGLYTKL